ncbi:MAG: hypothetical protein M3R24_24650 [Chloroflexota bacterium]|nr:hypothetical protein [Chloroflexota bacterium]
MPRFRRTRPAPQQVRVTTVKKSTHAITIHWWRYRHHFLEAKLAQLHERQQSSTPLPDAAAGPPRSVVLLHAVPVEDRAVFDEYVARKLAAALAAAGTEADPDRVEADTLTELIAEAEGCSGARGGWGWVPDAGGQSYDVSPIPTSDPAIVTAPMARRRPPWRTLLVAGIVLVGGLGYCTLLLLRQHGGVAVATGAAASAIQTAALTERTVRGDPGADPAGTASRPTPTPLGDIWEAPEDGVRPTSLELVRDTTFVLAIDAVPGMLGAAWTPSLQPGRAAWLDGSLVNLVLCLAPADHTLITAAQAGDRLTVRIANGETRSYVAAAPRVVGRQQREVLDQRHTGLTLVACGADGNDRHVLVATLADPPEAAERSPSTPRP